MKFLFSFLMMLGGTICSHAQFKNNKVTDNVAQASIVINHKNIRNIVIAPGTDSLVCSWDGGESWKPRKVQLEGTSNILKPPKSQSFHGILGKTVLLSASNGKLFFFHVAEPEDKSKKSNQLVCQSSSDNGRTWSLEAPIGTPATKDQDKPGAAIHPKKNTLCVTWTEFDKYKGDDPVCQSNILFSQSSNGVKWSEQQQINQASGDCSGGGNSVGVSTPVMDATKKIFIAWSYQQSIFVDRSYDNGNTWLTTDLPVAKKAGEWSIKIPGLQNCNRNPVLAIDNSNSFFRNSLYAVWADQSNGENDTDIWFTRSVNRGDYWNPPLRVNKDSSRRHQFMPNMAVDDVTGVIYIVYYDRRNYVDLQTDVYLAYSTDGGDKFKEIKISEQSFVPSPELPLGDGTNISAHKGVIAPIWIRAENGKTSLWTTIIDQHAIIKNDELPRIQTNAKQGAYARPVQNQYQRPRPK